MYRDEVFRYTKISAGLIVLSYSLAQLFIFAKNGFLLGSIATAFTAWVSYILIHYWETGILIDPRQEEKTLPEEEKNWIMLGIASILFATGMSSGAYGVTVENVLIASTGAAVLITGYFIAHFEFSDVIV